MTLNKPYLMPNNCCVQIKATPTGETEQALRFCLQIFSFPMITLPHKFEPSPPDCLA